jgi:hypothetical protein
MKKNNHNIVLLVDTETLKADCNESNLDMNDYCQFAGQDPSQNLELFTTEVEKNDTLFWIGLSTSSENDIVEIDDITRQSGAHLIEGPGGSGKPSKKGNGRIGKIKNNAKKNKWEKYDLKFKINSDPESCTRVFTIDPIINIHKK